MEKILFGTRKQAQDYANWFEYKTDKQPVMVGLKDFESGEGAPDSFSGETNALVVRNADFEVIGYLAYWSE